MSDLPALQIQREDQIRALLAGGMHPVKVARIITQRGFPITPEQVVAYGEANEIVPQPSPLSRHTGIDRLTDAHQDMHTLVLLEEDRVVSLLRLEKESGEVSAANNVHLNQLWRHLRELAELEHTLGLSPHEAPNQTAEAPKTVQTLREAILAAQQKGTVTLERLTVENG